ncbi:MAG: hypothetical protein EZS28_034994 [Streblomastix strix]|uniref:Uncharacterized protein n=1 Tax=Streblomastix strix TaxID=222440 RepID=A0A5J4UHN0_9EUKA|nr:MAG: hypothetical protein EZS28_034994 [Streblomastix strix]
MSSVYLDEAFLDAAGLSDFPELYTYIRERYQQPIPPAERKPIGEQTLQQQVKDNDDILSNTNEVFVPPVPNAPTKIDYGPQLQRQSYLAAQFGSTPQLIVYGDRVTLSVAYETTGLFPNGYLFKSYPEDARPKLGDKIVAYVASKVDNDVNMFCYIDQNGPYITSNKQIPSDTIIIINSTYYKKYEQLKQITYDSNNDGKVDIMDTWNVNGKGGTYETQSHVYGVVQKQTDLIASQQSGDSRHNYFNGDIKLQDELAIFKADRAAFLIKEGPFITYSFGAKVGTLDSVKKNGQTLYKIFSKIPSKVLPPYTKYLPVHSENYSKSAFCAITDVYDKTQAVQVVVNRQLDKLDCLFAGTYVLDNYENQSQSNGAETVETGSFIDEVIIKHDKQLAQQQIQYTITNRYSSITIDPRFNLDSSIHNSFHVVDDGTCKVCVFNLFFLSKGFNELSQVLGTIPDDLLPPNDQAIAFPASIIYRIDSSLNVPVMNGFFIINATLKQFIFSLYGAGLIPSDQTNQYQYCTSGLYYLN